MSFKNVRLPDCVSQGAVGGPRFKTTITETVSGDEYRNIEWSRVRGHWDVGYRSTHEANEEIIRFFYAMNGRAYGFRFKDWSDYQCDSVVGFGDGSNRVFQASKTYDLGNDVAFTRILTRIVEDTVSVYINDVKQTRFTLDYNTGRLTLNSTPAEGASVRLVCEFDVPVRFDTDDLDITMVSQRVSQIKAPLIEIRDRP